MPNIELTWQGIKECEVFWFESTPICMHPREKSLNFHNLDSKMVGLNYDVGLWNEQAKLTIKSSLNEVCFYEVLFKPIFGLSDKIGLLVLFEAVQAWSKRENEDKKPKFEV